MSLNKHTPGPWKVLGFGFIEGRDGDRDRDGVIVAKVGGYHDRELIPFNKRRWDSDARLIAAAPDLLEALDEIVEITDRDHVAWDRARAAIRKARGDQR